MRQQNQNKILVKKKPMSEKSKLYRKLARQGYLIKDKVGVTTIFRISLEGIRALHLLAERVTIQNISWDFVNAVGMNQEYCGDSIQNINNTTLKIAANLTSMATKSMSKTRG